MHSLRRLLKSAPAGLVVLLVAFLIFPFEVSAETKKKFVVVIDAGHGGSDHGAIENGINEKDVTLAVAQKLGALIKKKLRDTEVVFTRSDDSFVSLQKRADIANQAKADLFVSVHCNSVDRSNRNRANVVGATTYVLGHHKDNDNLAVAQRENAVVELDADDSTHYSEFDPESDESNIIFQMTQKKNFQNSIRFAADVQREMEAAGRVSRGVQQAGFWVLWSTAAPAALIELDFICNPEQARFLNSKDGQDKLAGIIFNAVKKYENYFRMSLGMASSVDSDAGISASSQDELWSADAGEVNSTETSAGIILAQEGQTPHATASVDLPSAESSDHGRRQHRQASSSANRRQTDGSHRRRSSAARDQGASQIEQVQIAMTEELNPDTPDTPSVVSVQQDAPSSGQVSTASGRKKKNQANGSAPARRDKDKKAGRRGVRQSVNVDYRVLLFMSDEELSANDDAFRGLTPVATFRENNKFKYTYGESADRADMDALLKEISSLFPEARVIKCYY